MKEKIMAVIMALFASMITTMAAPSSDWSLYCATSYANYDATNKTITISTPAQLALLADEISGAGNGHEHGYRGWTITLSADLDMSGHWWTTSIGHIQGSAVDYHFNATFDGQGHTISGLYYKSDWEGGNPQRYGGVFGVIGTAGTVKNLRITSSDYKIDSHGGVIVGWNYGRLENCHVGDDVVMAMAKKSAYNMGGLAGQNEGIIVGCSSKAKLSDGGYQSGYNVGGIVGINKGGTIQDCIFSGSVSAGNTTMLIGGIAGSCSGGTFINNYYTDDTLDGYYVDVVAPTDNTGAKVAMTAVIGQQAIVLGGSATMVYGQGNYTGINVYPNGMTLDGVFYYLDEAHVVFFAEGDGTRNNPYLISSTEEWDKMVVSFREAFCVGCYFEQTADITVSTMVGTQDYPFIGHYMGNDHTITLALGTSSSYYADQYCAPFQYTGTCEIYDVKLAGDIYTSNKFAGSLIGYAYSGNAYIENVLSTATIHSNVNGDGSHGGLVGIASGNVRLSFRGCMFAGSFIGSNTHSWGGFVGYRQSAGTVNIHDCVFKPSNISISGSNYGQNATFVRNGTSSLQNGYYITMLGSTAQGSPAYRISTNTQGLKLKLAHTNSSTYYGTIALDMRDMAFSINGDEIYLTGSSVNLDILTEPGYDFIDIYANVGTLSGIENPFTYQGGNTNATISATIVEAEMFGGEGTEDNPYVIASTANWNKLAAYVNRGETFAGKYFVMEDDIVINNRIANRNASLFAGNFNGQGHILSAYLSTPVEYLSPFSRVNGATIRNLIVEGSISGGIHAAGLVGTVTGGTNLIENCRVGADITCTGNSASGAHGGGLVGHATSSTLTVRGCLFNGTLTANASGSDTYGGSIIGWCTSASNIRVVDCVENASYINFSHAGYNYDSNHSATAIQTVNSYHFKNWGEACRARILSSATQEVSIENVGTSTEYDVAGIISYGTGIKIDETYYAGKGDVLSLTITPAPGYIFNQLSTSNGTLTNTSGNNYNLSVANDANITISATLLPADWADTGAGTAESPYLIYNQMQMKKFADEVNSGSTFSGKNFKLMADLTYNGTVNNFKPIGIHNAQYDDYQFLGVFDGGGHTISGINMTYTGNGIYTDSYVGLFGISYASSYEAGVVKNLTIKNSSFTGYEFVGPIMGHAAGTRIENCHVGDDVKVIALMDGAKYHGGIAGDIYNGGCVRGCTSAATLTAPIQTHEFQNWTNRPTEYSLGEAFGGIVGSNAAADGVIDCLYLGNTVQAKKEVGAIMGRTNGDNANYQQRNFYRGIYTYYGDNAETAHLASNIGWGWCNGEDPADGDGAKRGYRRISAPADLGNLVTTYGEGDYTGIIAYENGLYYDGAYYTENRLVLYDDADNTDIISENVGEVDLVISGRTLKKDGNWTTLCLPFDIVDRTDTPLEGATTMRLLSSTLNDSVLTITMSNSAYTLAGTPYFVKWTNGTDIINPTFDAVTLKTNINVVTSTFANFTGCFSPVELTAGDCSTLYYDADNAKIVYPSSATTLGAFRAYFSLNDIQAFLDFTSCIVNLGDSTINGIFLSGDIDNDGALTRIDVETLVALLLAGAPVTPESDVNNDGVLTLSDVTTLVNIIKSENNN